MGESWTDKTVSMGNVEKEEFDGELAHVAVSENGITVEFKDVNDWKRIRREIGEDTILRQVRWEDVESVEATTEHLYYPHIDVETGEGERRIYFLEDQTELLEQCLNAIERFWNAYRGSGSGSRSSYSYDTGEEGAENGEAGGEVELDEEVDTGYSESSGEEGETAGETESGDGGEADDSVEDVVEEFIDS